MLGLWPTGTFLGVRGLKLTPRGGRTSGPTVIVKVLPLSFRVWAREMSDSQSPDNHIYKFCPVSRDIIPYRLILDESGGLRG